MKHIRLFFIIAFSLILTSSKSNLKNSKLNVLLIIADDLNCDIGAYGNTTIITPNIDKLAQKGVLFGNAHVQFPWCGPSRASIMTGIYPDQTKIKDLRIYLRQAIPQVITIGQKFRHENYNSVRIGKIFHYHNPRDIGTAGHDDNYTWDQTINPYGRDKVEEYKINTLKPKSYGGTLSWLAADGSDEEQTDGIGASEAINFLEKFSKTGENFFLAFGLYRPHTPYVAPKKYYDLYETEKIEIPNISKEYLKTIPEPAARSVRSVNKKEQHNLDENLAKTIKEAYYATTSFVDAQVGRVLNKLEETGLDKNTIVVFTSDHGYHLGEHGHWQKQTLFNDATRVPLIFTGPGVIKDNIDLDIPVELVDLYPTIMDLLGFQAPKFVRGKSLKPYLEGSRLPIRTSALTELKVSMPKGMANGYSIKTKQYRLTQWKYIDSLYYELYDHRYDSNELNNLADNISYRSVRDSLKQVIRVRIAEAKKYPSGLGRQIDNVLPWKEPKRIHPKAK